MKRFAILCLCFVLGATLLAVCFPARATAEGAQAFSISPPLIELSADPGQTVKASITFTNVSGDELLIKNQINDFGAKNETGEPKIIFDEDADNTVYSLRQWVISPPPVKIGAHESKTIDFLIQVPAGAEPGGHYAVIRFTGSPPVARESSVALTASIGSLVMLQVSGDIHEDAEVAEFYSVAPNASAASGKRSMFENGPIGFVERLKNAGNMHIKPTGVIQVSSMFGRTVETLRVNGDPTNADNQPKSILPDSVRRFEQTMDKKWLFGRYTATIKLSYGQGQKPLEQTVTFWVIPYKQLLLMVIIGVALFFGLRWIIRKYNNHIIRQSRKSR